MAAFLRSTSKSKEGAAVQQAIGVFDFVVFHYCIIVVSVELLFFGGSIF